MVDVVEGSFEIGIEDIFVLLLDRIEDGFDRIMTGTCLFGTRRNWVQIGLPTLAQGRVWRDVAVPFLP